MAKMRWGNDIPWKTLNDAEYEEGEDFTEYDGEVPPANTLLRGVIKKVWATESSKGDPMLKVLFEASGNEDGRDEYNGCPVWDYVSFTLPQVKFKWQPFFDVIGFTLADLKNKCQAGEDDSIGTQILQIGSVKFPAAARIKTKREKYEGEWTAKVGRWLPAEDVEDDDDDTEDDDAF